MFKKPLFWIFLIALFLRVYKLDSFPVGLHIDEVKVGWNALSILKTGFDDHLNRFSLYYNSFGDFRPTGIFYFTIPSILIFGRSVFAIRFSVALFGALSVFPIYLLTNAFSKDYKFKFLNMNTGHLSAFLLAISPWHIEMSRATNEVVISSFFALIAIYFYFKLLNTGKYKFIGFTIASIMISYLTYHAIRFLAPPFFITTALLFTKRLRRSKNKIAYFFPVLFVCVISLLFSLTHEGQARFKEVSIFTGVDTNYEIQRIQSEDSTASLITHLYDSKYTVYIKHFISQYSNYFAGDFLIGESARPYRFTTPGTGLITYVELVLLLFGLIRIAQKKASLLPLLLLLIAPLPAAITTEDTPNLSRAFLMIPFLLIIEAYGFYSLITWIKKYQRKAMVFIILMLLLNFSYFEWMYFSHSTNHRPYLKDFFVDSPTYRNVGAIDLAYGLSSMQNKYDKIVVTDFPDNPYAWYAFFTDKDPREFNQTYKKTTNERDFENIIFSELKCPTDTGLTNITAKKLLVIDSWECDYKSQIKAGLPAKLIGTINRKDGTEVYSFLEKVGP